MIYFSDQSYLKIIVSLLSIAGEFPIKSLRLIGNERVVRALVHKLTKKQKIRNVDTGEELEGKLFTVSGKGSHKTLRFYRGMLPVMEWVHEDAYSFYMNSYQQHRFPGGLTHLQRNHRVAEAVCMFMSSGVEVRPYLLPKLQNVCLTDIIGEEPVYFNSKTLKKIGDGEMNKTMFTRIVGMLFAGKQCYAVYNTRNAVMKWHGLGEFKALHSLIEISRCNSSISGIDSAILFGDSEDIVLHTILESDKSRRLEFRFDSVYRHIHFVPLNETGMRLIKLMCFADWKERILEALFDRVSRSFGLGAFEYDAKINGVFVFSFLDWDIARLLRFRDAVTNQNDQYEIICFPQQVDFLQKFVTNTVRIKTIEMDAVEKALGIE